MKTPAITTDPQQGPTVSVAGGTYRVALSGKQTGGAFAVIEMTVPPGGGPIPHAHPHFQECFYVLDGEVEVKTETQQYVAVKGSLVNVPTGGIVHCFKNKSANTARLLCTVVPAGLEDFFLEVGQPLGPNGEINQQPPTPEMLERIKAAAEKYGQQLFPPGYLDEK
ncbi:cupin domain-containing protein [Foetidibacter luteolus]|uniref:cupin domain-containing protein n=1 Tax=Foetidibacter luteolus TaxID=2608880 RepID=UPI00129AB2C2|nr:cupin domain-containing protein [Foetidibacter luteolus]